MRVGEPHFWSNCVVEIHMTQLKKLRLHIYVPVVGTITENFIAITDKKNIGDNRYFDKTIIAEKIIGEENR